MLGYGKGEIRGCSKVIEAREDSSEDSKPLFMQEQPCIHGRSISKDFKSSPKRYEHSKGGVKTISPHQTCTKDNPKRYDKHQYSKVFFNYEKNGHVKKHLWYAYPCTFCGLNNHCVAKCWKRKSLQRQIMSSRMEEICKYHSPRKNRKNGKK